MQPFLKFFLILGIIYLTSCKSDLPLKEKNISYDGIQFADWVKQYSANLPNKRDRIPQLYDQATNALMRIGDRAFPLMICMAGKKTKPDDYWVKKQFNNNDAYYQRNLAFYAFSFFKEKAKPEVPQLIKLLKDKDLEVQVTAAKCLGCIGHAASNAVPTLLDKFESKDSEVRMLSVWAVRDIFTPNQKNIVLKALIHNLPNTKTSLGIFGIELLPDFGPDSEAALPVLQQLLKSNDIIIRSYASNAIVKINMEISK